jgi:hypothetical protein
MYAPTYHLPAPKPSVAVLDAEHDILAEEGPYHVNGCYFACEADANSQRRWEAERRVRNFERWQAWQETQALAARIIVADRRNNVQPSPSANTLPARRVA